MDKKFRCDCPITSALDVLGDKWMLVIVKQMLLEERRTFKDFIAADEAVASNILSAKLKLLEDLKLVEKSKLPNNKKTNVYHLTEKGLSLIPIIVELTIWSDENLREFHPIIQSGPVMASMKADKEAAAMALRTNYQQRLAEAHPELVKSTTPG